MGFLPWDTFSKIALPKAAIIEYKNRSPLTLLPEHKITSPNSSPAFFINDSSKQNLFYKQFYLILYTQYDNCNWSYIPCILQCSLGGGHGYQYVEMYN